MYHNTQLLGHSSTVQCITEGTRGQREYEAAGHIECSQDVGHRWEAGLDFETSRPAPVIHFLSEAPPPKVSTTFQNSTKAEDPPFTHISLRNISTHR